MSDLEARLLAAHATGDGCALIGLYEEAAKEAADETASGFYLTHAFIYALEQGDARAGALRMRLRAMGRM